MRTTTLYNYLDSLYPITLREEWDNDGIMCMPCDKEITKVLLSLDVTPNTVKKTKELSCELIVTHHPMIFSPLKSIVKETYIDLIKNDISVFSFHTRLDAANGGVNDALAEALNLCDIKPFCQMGRIGRLKNEISFDDFVTVFKEKTGARNVNCVKNIDKINKVAVLGGSGKDFWKEAMLDADVYLTGEMGYHAMLDAYEAGANIIEGGHFFTEIPVLYKLSAAIKNADPAIKTKILHDFVITPS